MIQNPKLTVELVPSTCHYSNVRSTVTPAEWDKLRKLTYHLANNKCEICNSDGTKQGYKHRVEAHEIWHYDDKNHIQTLTGLISLCPLCHLTKHIGRAMAIGNQNIAYNHLMKVNNWKMSDVQEHITKSFQLHKVRSKHQWKLDITLLKKEPYNLTTINENQERVFDKPEIKKKAKTKPKVKNKVKAKKIHPAKKLSNELKKLGAKNKRPPKQK